MEDLFELIVRLLLQVGPWIIFLVTFAETAIFVGLLVPAEATVLLGAFLADAGHFSVWHVLLATTLGGFLGDQAGYAFGRFGGPRLAAHSGFTGRMWRRYESVAGGLFRRHSLIGISLARFISFVRTLMPWFAGMSRIPYGRYLIYDLIGVTGWAVASVALGVAAGKSWRTLAEALGTASAIIVALLLVGGLLAARRRHAAQSEPPSRERDARVVRIGLTGNIASGKSAVGRVWQRLGAIVIDADQLARKAVAPGSPGLAKVAEEFGAGVIAPDGSLDRAALRTTIFGDPVQRARLEGILHPEIDRLRKAEEARLLDAGARMIVHDIPLLYEVGMESEFDVVVLVDAPPDVRRDRIVHKRGLSVAEAEEMMAAQMPASRKRELADIVIENDGTLEELVRAAEETWQELTTRASA